MLIVLISVLDRVFQDFEYRRELDLLLILLYGLVWLAVYRAKPDIFQ